MAETEEEAKNRRAGEIAAEREERKRQRLADLEEEKKLLEELLLIERDAVKQGELTLAIDLKLAQAEQILRGGQEKKIANLKKLQELDKEQTASTQALTDALGGLVGMNKSYETSMLGSISATLTSGKAFKKWAGSMMKTFSIQNMAYSVLLKFTQATTQLMWEQDAALVSFNRQTGAARLYGDELAALEENLYTHGVNMTDAAEAGGALVRTVHGLKTMSSLARKDLMETTAILQELGVSADTTGANVHFMTRALGMSVKESAKYQIELFALAQQIGMPPAEMAEGFKSAQPKLAAFGKDAGRVFKKLATAARASGMEVQQMLGIVEQFDTFEGAATSVGKLNALLGGPFLNSMEMVMQTDPTERMRMLSGALNKAGKSFDQLTYYEKKSIAAAAGLSDVNELALVMAGNFTGVAGGAQKSQAEIQRLAEQTKEFNEIGEELLQIMRMFAVQMRPVIKKFKDFLESIQEQKKAFEEIRPSIVKLAATILVLSAAWTAMGISAAFGWGAVLLPLGAVLIAIGITMALYEQLGFLEAAFWGLSIATGAVAVAMYGLTWPLLGIVVAVGAALAALTALMNMMFFTDVGESNFIQGIRKFGKANHKLGEEMHGVKSASDELNKSLKNTSDISISTLRSEKALAKAQRPRSARARVRAEAGVGTTALAAANTASSRPAASSTLTTAPAAAQEVVVKLEWGDHADRYLKGTIKDTANKALSAVTDGN